jgi:beta-lactamase class D
MAAFFSCRKKHSEASNTQAKKVTVPEFQGIIDSAEVSGAILVYDLNENIYYSNDFKRAKRGKLPASTFKIPHSIIALETGLVGNDQTLFRWNGEKRALKMWERDMVFRDAFHLSCVPCYQEIARKIGVHRMNDFLNRLKYGTMIVDSASIDNFWLEGNSTITLFQQLNFLKRFYQSELSISERTEKLMKKLMIIENRGDYILRGKTGWSIRNGNNNGWYIGYLESNEKVYFFGVNIEPKEAFDMDLFPLIRKEVADRAFHYLGIME